MLYAGDDAYESSLTVTEGVHLTSTLESLRAVANDEGPERFMIALGYAGWQGGQLESEIARNVWLTVEANPSVLFDQPFERRLDAAAGLLGIDLSLVSLKRATVNEGRLRARHRFWSQTHRRRRGTNRDSNRQWFDDDTGEERQTQLVGIRAIASTASTRCCDRGSAPEHGWHPF